MVAAQRGDLHALDALVRHLEQRLGPLCGSIALADGDDALQEALMVVVRKLGELREPRALDAWARRIAVREALRIARRRRRVTPVVEDVEDAAVSAAAVAPVVDRVVDLDTAIAVRDVLATLPAEQRAVLVLRHLEDLGEDETAAVLGVSAGTVKSRTHRARRAFTARWER